MKHRIVLFQSKIPKDILENCQYYLKQLPKHWGTEILPSASQQHYTQQLKRPQVLNVGLDRQGQDLSTLEFHQWLIGHQKNFKQIQFFIGSDMDIPENVANQLKIHLSLSKLTFPHMQSLVILVEQIYRAYTIESNKAYHK